MTRPALLLLAVALGGCAGRLDPPSLVVGLCGGVAIAVAGVAVVAWWLGSAPDAGDDDGGGR